MKKIISLFKRDYEGESRLVYNEIVPGAEWVINGEGIATVKYDGTCCLIQEGLLYKRYDRKMIKRYYDQMKNDKSFIPGLEHYKVAPEGWEAVEKQPNHHTGHWPGWLAVDEDKPEDKWHREAFRWHYDYYDGTYELIGPKIQANPYKNNTHRLIPHGRDILEDVPVEFDELKKWFESNILEGIVWHRDNGDMVKIKRSDFGLPWPE